MGAGSLAPGTWLVLGLGLGLGLEFGLGLRLGWLASADHLCGCSEDAPCVQQPGERVGDGGGDEHVH